MISQKPPVRHSLYIQLPLRISDIPPFIWTSKTDVLLDGYNLSDRLDWSKSFALTHQWGAGNLFWCFLQIVIRVGHADEYLYHRGTRVRYLHSFKFPSPGNVGSIRGFNITGSDI